MYDVLMTEKCKKKVNSLDKCTKHRYEKSKLLELRKNKKCQEWPKVLNKRFTGSDGKWDPVGAFECNNFQQRNRDREDVQPFYTERYRKRQRDDYKYYYFDDDSTQYNSSYESNYSRYYPSNSKHRYQYEDDIVYETSLSRAAQTDYYPSYSYQSSKSRSANDTNPEEPIVVDSKPEWFTGGPNTINETIELSGMSKELEAGILKNHKPSRRSEDKAPKSPKLDSNKTFSMLSADNELDSHLMKIIKNNAKENEKKKSMSSAKEVEKLLKSILLRPNKDCQEAASLSQNSNGIVRTVNEIEADLKLKGNRGAGDMSAYYKLLGLVQRSSNDASGNEVSMNHTETSTNNNHPRQSISSKYISSNSTQIEKNLPVPDVIQLSIIDDSKNCDSIVKKKPDISSEHEEPCAKTSEIVTPKMEEINSVDIKKTNGFNHFSGVHASNNATWSERLAMASRNICHPMSSQFSNHMFSSGQMGQNAFRWIRAMNNAAAASARITQMNQHDHYLNTENSNINSDPKLENCHTSLQIPDSNVTDYSNMNFDGNVQGNVDQTNGVNHMNNYINSLNLNNYMGPCSALFNQLSMKSFLPLGYNSQNSMFGRQLLNPYILQQLLVHKQWENRNLSLQNQLRQFQSTSFNPQQSCSNTIGSSSNSTTAGTVLFNQGDCSGIGINK